MRRFAASCVVALCVLVGAASVIRWQLGIAQGGPIQLEETERMDASQGVCRDLCHKFVYFYYYLGLLPVTSTAHIDQFSEEAAQEFVSKNGTLISNDVNSGCAIGRLGDWGRILLYLPKAWITQSAYMPSVVPATSALFITGLVAVLVAAFFNRRFILGTALVVFVGSYKLQLFWSYFADNVHGLLISSMLLVLAINFRFVCQQRVSPRNRDWMLAVTSALVIGSIRTARGDCLPLAVSIVLLYLISGQRWYRRIGLSLAFVGSLLLVSTSFDVYFMYKLRQSQNFITSVGGKIYGSGYTLHHSFWHPVAAGLGDFGTDRGFTWDDGSTYRLGLDRVNQVMGRRFVIEQYYFVEPLMKPEQWIKPEALPEYDQAVGEVVVNTIREHPLWYLTILYKRAKLLLQSMRDIRVGLSLGEVSLPFTPWLLPVVLVVGVLLKKLDYLKLILLAAPTAFIPIFIYSGHGTAFLSIVHLVVGAVLVEAAVLVAARLGSRVWSKLSPSAG